MTAVKSTLLIIALVVIFPDASSWIVDIAQVEKLLGDHQYDEQPNYDDISLPSDADDKYESNEVIYTSNYAENFSYETFKKKEVASAIKDGGVYLEKLSNAMAAFRETLDNCSKNSLVEKPGGEQTRCQRAEDKMHFVQQLSAVAMLTADKLRDTDYENTKQDAATEEADLIQLAWSLDRLARLTGDEGPSDTAGYAQDNNSSVLHTAVGNVMTEDVKEILEQVENGRPVPRFPPTALTDVTSVQKRDTTDVMKYYLKYKVWNGSNPIDGFSTNDSEQFDVENSFKVIPIRKRSIADKKAINMRSVIKKVQCKLKDHPKTSIRKLVKSIKVYRRKLFKNNSH